MQKEKSLANSTKSTFFQIEIYLLHLGSILLMTTNRRQNQEGKKNIISRQKNLNSDDTIADDGDIADDADDGDDGEDADDANDADDDYDSLI